MIIVIYVIICIYLLLMLAFLCGITKKKKSYFLSQKPITTFSIVVPFRNESENLKQLLTSFQQLEYSSQDFEIILVNDHSEDDFQLSGYNLPIVLLNLTTTTSSPKKAAIELAISHSKKNWIVTTDADCIVSTDWLLQLDNFIQNHSVEMIAGPVFFQESKGLLYDFQQIEMVSLQSVTIGSFGLKSPFMCNGANFAYSKDFFKKMNGFKGNEMYASGDDVFLLQKAVQQYPEQVEFLFHPDFFVKTKTALHLKSLLYQRVRWAGKSTAYSSFLGKFSAVTVFLANLSLIIAFAYLLSGNFEVLPLLVFKGLIDVILAFQVARFYSIPLHNLFPTYLMYPFFSSVVGIWSLFGKYEWKGRRF